MQDGLLQLAVYITTIQAQYSLSNLTVAYIAIYNQIRTDYLNILEAISHLNQSLHHLQEPSLPTLDSIVEEKRQRFTEQQVQPNHVVPVAQHIEDHQEGQGDTEELEEEVDQQGAFNPETGEINWDCPCLGGMAHGPCGEEFKAAFSCFVYSKEEPKGMECIEKFK